MYGSLTVVLFVMGCVHTLWSINLFVWVYYYILHPVDLISLLFCFNPLSLLMYMLQLCPTFEIESILTGGFIDFEH